MPGETTDLVDRIAETVVDNQAGPGTWDVLQEDALRPREDRHPVVQHYARQDLEAARETARAVIAALGLTEERLDDSTYEAPGRVVRRWVTPWEQVG